MSKVEASTILAREGLKVRQKESPCRHKWQWSQGGVFLPRRGRLGKEVGKDADRNEYKPSL
jgi:hypothetical protein